MDMAVPGNLRASRLHVCPSDSAALQRLTFRLFQRPTEAAAAEGREPGRPHAAVLRLLQGPPAGVFPTAWVGLHLFRVVSTWLRPF